MTLRFLLAAILLALPIPTTPPQEASPAAVAADPALASITEEDLREKVTFLASAALEGRRGTGGQMAAEWIAERFRKAGLKPLSEEAGFLQPVKDGDGEVAGRNVVGFLPGTDEALAKQHVIVSAHFDHLGKRNGRVFHGADDNASGVAALLETIEAFEASGRGARRTLCFVAFDLEEVGLVGSRRFADHPPFPLSDLALFITCDMLGRSLGGIVRDTVFVLGTEHAPELRTLVEGVPVEGGLRRGFVGTDLIGIRSDYGPFRARGIPYLFFSTGTHPDYHKPTDTADKIEYPKLESISRLLYGVARAAADAPERPAFVKDPEPDLREVELVAEVLRRVEENAEALGAGEEERGMLRALRRRVDAILERGTVSREDRRTLRQAAQLLILRLIR